jgi:hypothetical protein
VPLHTVTGTDARRLEARHPEIEIKSPIETSDRNWWAQYREGQVPEGKERRIVYSMDLGWLLGELERQFDSQ